MPDTVAKRVVMDVEKADDIVRALEGNADEIVIHVPEGKLESEFISELALRAAEMPRFEGNLDMYEIEAVIRDLAGINKRL